MKQSAPKELILIIGNNLKKIRIERGLTQLKLSELSNVERTLIVKIEKREHAPSLQTLCKLAIGLGVKPNELLEEYETIFKS